MKLGRAIVINASDVRGADQTAVVLQRRPARRTKTPAPHQTQHARLDPPGILCLESGSDGEATGVASRGFGRRRFT